ncbi:MAG: DUF5989 family protein [Polyangiaceae bacterium]
MGSEDQRDDFEREAKQEQSGFFAELWAFLRQNKKWWLTPIIVTILAVGVLALLGSSAAAPFIYTLF